MAFVQSKQNGSSIGVIVITFDNPPVAGRHVVVFEAGEDADITSIADTAGNSYRAAIESPGGSPRCRIFYAQNIITATPFTVTITLSSVVFANAAIHEYSALLTTGAAGSDDGGACIGGTGTVATGSGTTPATNSVTPSGASTYTYCAGVDPLAAATTISTPSNSFNQREEDETFNFGPFQTADKIGASGSQSTGWTLGTSQAWIALIAAFNEIGGAAFKKRAAVKSMTVQRRSINMAV